MIAAAAAALCLPSPLVSQTLRGRLLDGETGRQIAAGYVVMLAASGDSLAATLTNERGYFSLTSPEAGGFFLQASALGYEDAMDGVFELGMGGEMTVEFRMRPAPLPVEEIAVSLDRPVFEHQLVRNGFVNRYHSEPGGEFITPYDLKKSIARSTEDLFSGRMGFRVTPSTGPRSNLTDDVLMVSRGQGLCRPVIVIDGVRIEYDPADAAPSIRRGGQPSPPRAPPRVLSHLVPLSSLAAVEIYRTPADVPPQFNMTRSGPRLCGVILFWTKDGR